MGHIMTFNKFSFPYITWDGIESTIHVESIIVQKPNRLADNLDDFLGYREVEFYGVDTETGDTIAFCPREKNAIEDIIIEKV